MTSNDDIINETTPELCRRALIRRYGSLEEAVAAAVDNKQLSKFIFEHALGKPTETTNLAGSVDVNITITRVSPDAFD
jgi:hypothetical protein